MKLEPEPDSIITPEDGLAESLKLEGSSNDTDHNQFLGSDEVDALGDGIAGYQSTGQEGSDDQIEQQQEQQTTIPSPRPS